MKNKKIEILFIIIIIYTFFLGSLYIEAAGIAVQSTFAGIPNSLTNFHNKLEDTNIYFQNGPFTCSGSNKINCSGSEKIGTISKREFEIIGSDSYLKPKNSDVTNRYWINQISGSDAYIATLNGLSKIAQTSDSGIRASIYIKPDVTLLGSGTYYDPYVLLEKEVELEGTGDINILAFYVDADGDGSFEDDPNGGLVETISPSGNYQFVQATCEDKNKNPITANVSYKDSNKSVTITNVTGYIACKIYLKNITGTVASMVNYDKIAIATSDTSFVIDSKGTLWGWGKNNDHFLSGSNYTISTPIKLLETKTFKKVFSGWYRAQVIDSEDKLWMWGYNGYSSITTSGTDITINNAVNIMPEKTFLKACNGVYHSAAIDTAGNMWIWGRNNYGQLGLGATYIETAPQQILVGTNKFIDLACGYYSTYAIDTDNHLYSWGDNSSVQLGLGYVSDTSNCCIYNPTQVESSMKFKNVSAGATHALAIDIDGILWGWGRNNHYQIGDGTGTTGNLRRMSSNKFVSTNANHYSSSAIDTTGKLWRWGDNSYGQQGVGTSSDLSSLYIDNKGYLAMVAGEYSSIFIDSNYGVWSAGKGDYLGIGGNTNNYLTLQRVHTIPNIFGEY